MNNKNETVDSYYGVLKKFAVKKELIFNPDEASVVLPLVKGLLANKQRYGYPTCPCRLAQGSFEHDRDIICPCVYAAPDIAAYGKCYCGLYVGKDFPGDRDPDYLVPERRPE